MSPIFNKRVSRFPACSFPFQTETYFCIPEATFCLLPFYSLWFSFVISLSLFKIDHIALMLYRAYLCLCKWRLSVVKQMFKCNQKSFKIMMAMAQWASALILRSGELDRHCSQQAAVSLGKTLHPNLLLWVLSTVFIVTCDKCNLCNVKPFENSEKP